MKFKLFALLSGIGLSSISTQTYINENVHKDTKNSEKRAQPHGISAVSNENLLIDETILSPRNRELRDKDNNDEIRDIENSSDKHSYKKSKHVTAKKKSKKKSHKSKSLASIRKKETSSMSKKKSLGLFSHSSIYYIS